MSETDFDKFIKRQKSQSVERAEVDWNARRDQWLKDVRELYAQVEEFLRKYVTSGDIVARHETIEVNEEKLGTYKAPSLVLRIGPQEVVLKPIGALVIGARGRVDLIGPKGRTRLVLVPKESSKIEIRIAPVKINSPPEPEPPKTEWRWKIATSPPRITFTELNPDSLMDAIMEVANA